MSDSERTPEAPGQDTAVGGENLPPEGREGRHDGGHDSTSREPLGPLTPDDDTPLGDTPEAHDEIIPQDLPKDHPGRQEAERQAAQGDGTVRGNT
jgi:hypothetical protein